MLSNSPLFSSTQNIDDKDADEVPDKGDDDVNQRNGQGKEGGASNKEDGQHNNTNKDSTASPYISTAGLSINTASKNINTGSPNSNTASPIPNNLSMQSLEKTGIFNDAYDDRKVGVEANLNNLETTMNVSPIPTTRIHKDHPKDQIIRDINSATQIRRMTKISKEHAMKVIQALTDPSWIEAMQEELLQFKLQKVWTLVDLPKGKRAIGTKWVYRNKKDERGIVVRNKARLMDVKSAFLYGTIEEEVYVCQPPGFEDPQFPDKVYKVEKALYGLHQAPRAWYETLSTYLLENGFRRKTGINDKTFFYLRKDKGDILLVQMSSMGELTFFLGLQVKQKDDGIFISQDKYVADILKKFDFVTMKTASTPIETNKALLKDEEAKDVDVHLYRSLMYLTASRPDIMFAVCACARFQVTPKVSHLHAVKRIFRYLKGQPKLGLWYPRDSPFDLEAFSDSDYARASLDRKSTTRGCQFLGKRLISWQCKKQTIVANSINGAGSMLLLQIVCLECCGSKSYALIMGSISCTPRIYIDNDIRDKFGNKTGSCKVNTARQAKHIGVMKVKSLESDLKQTKLTYGAAYTKLIMKVKKLENKIKSSKARRRVRLIVSEDENDLEDPSKQGRKITQLVRWTQELLLKKTKLQLEQERLGYEEALRLQEQLDEEERKGYPEFMKKLTLSMLKNGITYKLKLKLMKN
ncbi:putative ribonuclease H-like domain-containing protein [Tanacetum coccineum]